MIWYNRGIHIKVNGVHILCDPTYTTDEAKEWEEYKQLRKNLDLDKDDEDVDIILISHGHTDHIDRLPSFSKKNVKVLAHPMTINLRSTLFSGFKDVQQILCNQTINFRGVTITTYNAGHCGGSLMFLISDGKKKILFTGDFNTSFSLTLSPALPIECDILIMEASFGNPKYVFPNRNDVFKILYNDLNELFKKYDAILMFVQSLGKLQEIVKFIRSLKNNDIRLALDHYGYICTKTYELHYGKINNEINHFDDDITKYPRHSYIKINTIFSPKKKTLILSHFSKDLIFQTVSSLSNRFGLIEPPIMIVTGLHKDMISNIIDFYDPYIYPISNHCDYNALIEFAKACNPKKICVFHGEAKIFKKEGKKHLSSEIVYIHGETCSF